MTPIDITGFTPATLRDQPQPSLIWCDIADMVIDHRYQRGLTGKGRTAIQRIADAWDWRKYQPILVAPAEGGKFAVVDGQHRAHAAAVAGIDSLPAMTVAMTLTEQAAGFTAVNRDRIKISTLQLLRADLAAGDENAIASRDAVVAAGCTIATANPSASHKQPGTVYSVGLIRKMVRNGEGAAVTTGLRAIRQSDLGSEPRSYDGTILAPWLDALAMNQRFAALPLSDLFTTLDLDIELEMARSRSRRTGTPARALVREVILSALRAAQQGAAA